MAVHDAGNLDHPARPRRSLPGIGALASLLLAGCATVVSGTSQTVFVETPGVEGASCRLTDSNQGSWYLPRTPGAVTVQKGAGPMNVVCEKQGYETTVVTVEEQLAPATLGNIILGGGIGLFVDAASGAAERYPDKIVVWMKPLSFASPEQEAAWNAARQAQETAAKPPGEQ
ncbi:MAG: hypothetical protein N2038_14985 [Geminicoccaceae bacterium]|nr:hypothetical protein [Geminicoccaceae bacterium]MDW8370843.1 hypothetical protein [Geminicoccaceae bacterium]